MIFVSRKTAFFSALWTDFELFLDRESASQLFAQQIAHIGREREDKHTCHLYIAFCSGLGYQHSKGADGSRYQSIYELTDHEPFQSMSDDVKPWTKIDHYTGNYAPYSFRIVCTFFKTSHRAICEQGLWDGGDLPGLSSLSEKTRKFNHLQMSLQRQHFLLIVKDLEC